jgi:hypothetical protein
MTGNSHERRVDKRSFNIMQRVFDDLTLHPNASVDELCARLRIDRLSVLGGLRRLRLVKAVRASCVDGETWRYSLKSGAERPRDRRGTGGSIEGVAA